MIFGIFSFFAVPVCAIGKSISILLIDIIRSIDLPVREWYNCFIMTARFRAALRITVSA